MFLERCCGQTVAKNGRPDINKEGLCGDGGKGSTSQYHLLILGSEKSVSKNVSGNCEGLQFIISIIITCFSFTVSSEVRRIHYSSNCGGFGGLYATTLWS